MLSLIPEEFFSYNQAYQSYQKEESASKIPYLPKTVCHLVPTRGLGLATYGIQDPNRESG
jgi:hypothetical protein